MVLGSVLIVPLHDAAQAHEWYPRACCQALDCAPIPNGTVRFTGDAWEILDIQEVIPLGDDRLRVSSDFQFHRCRTDFWECNNSPQAPQCQSCRSHSQFDVPRATSYSIAPTRPCARQAETSAGKNPQGVCPIDMLPAEQVPDLRS
jgi:hypothetical protein